SLSSRAPRTTHIHTLSLHDALPIYPAPAVPRRCGHLADGWQQRFISTSRYPGLPGVTRDEGRDTLHVVGHREQVEGPQAGEPVRSEEHTSELQSRGHLVCRLLLEKK